MFNIFPFDNSITKMQLSGVEVQEMFDFVARRSASRGCVSQVQIAGARVRLNCAGCDRINVACQTDVDCTSAKPPRSRCDQATKRCVVHCTTDADCTHEHRRPVRPGKQICIVNACAEQVYIGHDSTRCVDDDACNPPGDDGPGSPASATRPAASADGLCLSLISPTNLYELATSNYLAGGGSGFRVLQRNTTQFDTKIQQRDALIDYMRAGKPCGYDPVTTGRPTGSRPARPTATAATRDFVCSCPGHVDGERNAASPARRPAPATTARDVASARTAATGRRSSTSRAARARPISRPARSRSPRASSPARSASSSPASTRRSAAVTDGRVELVGQ